MDLPLDLRLAIDQELSEISPKELSEISGELSRRYREGRNSKKEGYLKSGKDVTAYAAFRLPATYAAVASALKQVSDISADLAPKSLLDVGAGPGTAMWAATSIWQDIEKITLLERESSMIELGRRLAAVSTKAAIREAEWIKTDITSGAADSSFDLVIASYSLGELRREDLTEVIRKLWALTGRLLVIIEPGTPAGFSCVKAVRETVIKKGGKTLAPCPHNEVCPIPAEDWCHFSQRVPRSRLHRIVKGGELSYEDEKFSYVALRHEVNTGAGSRIIRHPQIRKGHIQLQLCTTEGIKAITVARSEKEAYKRAKDLYWGSEF
jgi:ribosomal protein RSM22 (predicted rRNA methylase)